MPLRPRTARQALPVAGKTVPFVGADKIMFSHKGPQAIFTTCFGCGPWSVHHGAGASVHQLRLRLPLAAPARLPDRRIEVRVDFQVDSRGAGRSRLGVAIEGRTRDLLMLSESPGVQRGLHHIVFTVRRAHVVADGALRLRLTARLQGGGPKSWALVRITGISIRPEAV